MITECSRMPVDDPNTHLELTMIHEVMSAAKPNCSWLKWAVKQPLKGFLASFLRPNANHLINREDEDYSVANLSGASRTKDRVHRPVDPSVRNRNFKFHFGHESAVVLAP